jgi:hypothetical protein
MDTIIDTAAKKRTAQIKRLSDGKIIGNKITINSNMVLPFVYVNDAIGARQQVGDPMIAKSQSNLLKLVDQAYENNNNGTERFVEMVLPMNPFTGSSYSMYYDRLYSDLFILPDLEMFALPGIISAEINIDGYSIGGVFNAYSQSCFHSYIDKVSRKKLTLVDKPTLACDGKLMLMTGFGRVNNGRFSHVNLQSSSGGYVQRSLDEYVDMITLPKLGELFSNLDDVDSYLFYQNQLANFSLVKISTLDSSARLSILLPA